MKLFRLNLLLLLSLIIIGSSCKKAGDGDGPAEASEHLDVAYGPHELNKMDVYLPADRGDTTNVIFLLHGGGWYEGDKADLTERAKYFRGKGFAVVNLNYRLAGTAGGHVHPAQQNDIAAAVNFVSAKYFEWKISKDRYAIAGISAGAHLALLYTYAYNTNDKIKAVVSLAGPTNFVNPGGISTGAAAVPVFLGVDLNNASLSTYIQASPLARANTLSKPTLLIHGTADGVVAVEHSRQLHEKLTNLGVPNTYEEVGTGHEVFSDANTQDLLDKIEAFLKEYVK
jgi:acetyl esterase/lipase